MLSPRGHLKTSIFGIDYPLWFALRDRVEVCITSNKVGQAQENLRGITNIVFNNDFFAPYRPDDKEQTKTKSEIELKNGSRIYVRPFSDRIVGVHPHLLILDDVELESEYSHQQITDIFRTCIYPLCNSPMVYSQLKVIGTPKDIGDLIFYELRKPSWGFAWRRWQAVITDDQGKWLKPLWHERTTLEHWKRERERMGEWAFQRELMCEPTAAGKCFVKEHHIYNCLDYGTEFVSKLLSGGYVTMGCDFGWGENEKSDYCVFTVAQHLPAWTKKTLNAGDIEIKNVVVVRGISRFRHKEPRDVINRAYNMAVRYGVQKINADVSQFGKAIIDGLRAKGLPVTACKFDPNSRNDYLINLAFLLEEEKMIIPAKDGMDAESLRASNTLIGELKCMKTAEEEGKGFVSTSMHDDCVMSLALACKDFRIMGEENRLSVARVLNPNEGIRDSLPEE